MLQEKPSRVGNKCDRQWSRQESQQHFEQVKNFVTTIGDSNVYRICCWLRYVPSATPLL